MYKILIKYTSTSNKTFWQSHMTTSEDGTTIEFSTSDMAVLKNEIRTLDAIYGFENLRIINDVTYSINVDVFDDIENVEPVQPEDVTNIYKTAFNKIFTEEV